MSDYPRVGRELKLKRDGVAIAGVRTKSFTINRNPVDVTNDDDLGYRSLLSDPGEIQIDFSVDGVTKDSILRAAAMSTANVLEDLELEWPDGYKIEMDFFLASYEESGNYNEAITFSASFQGTGVPTITDPT
jgi:TP901-1 family phage major tail protein